MSRLIDADELMEEIKKMIQPMSTPDGAGMYDMEINAYDEAIVDIMRTINKQPTVNEWIPCSDRLPEDYDNRFYMCTVENHEDDPPMLCQYEEEYGFGFWNDIYDGHTLGFVDSEFRTNEELGYEKVIAWMPLPESYNENENE